jgi:hypothetical protein
MSIKENIKFCGTTIVPEGSRVKISPKAGSVDLRRRAGKALDPFGLYSGQRGWISVYLDEPVFSNVRRVNVKASEVEIIK